MNRTLINATAFAGLVSAVIAAETNVDKLDDCTIKMELSRMSNQNRRAAEKDGDSVAADRTAFEAFYRSNLYREKVVYGTDDRSDVYAVLDAKIEANIRGTVALVKNGNLRQNTDGSWAISAPTLQVRKNVCVGDATRPDERFANQPTAAFCTGFLVGPDRIVTAGHCVKDPADVATFKIVFGYGMVNSTTVRATYRADEVYSVAERVGHRYDPSNVDPEDWAVLRLDKRVVDRPFLSLRKTDRIPDGEAVYVIGCPVGLPMKYAGRANVRDNAPKTHFVANLDTYGGNSGSPVFAAGSHEVEGILVRGETDFVDDPAGCKRSNVCPDAGCRGEDVTRIRLVPAKLIAQQ